MKLDDIADAIRLRIANLGRTAAEVSRNAVRTKDAVARIYRGRSPDVETLDAICREIGLEFYIGPLRTPADPSLGSPERSNDTVPADLAAALGLPASATVADAVAKIETLVRLRNAVADALPGAPLEPNQPAITPPAARAKARK